MGIYDTGIDFAFPTGAGKNLPMIAAAVVGALLLIALLYFGSQAIKPSALEIRFEKSPIKPSETTNVFVKITNITKEDASNVPLTVYPKEANEFYISPNNEGIAVMQPVVIQSLSAGTYREIRFAVNPVGSKQPGTYVLVAKTTINGEQYEKEIVLTVQN